MFSPLHTVDFTERDDPVTPFQFVLVNIKELARPYGHKSGSSMTSVEILQVHPYVKIHLGDLQLNLLYGHQLHVVPSDCPPHRSAPSDSPCRLQSNGPPPSWTSLL